MRFVFPLIVLLLLGCGYGCSVDPATCPSAWSRADMPWSMRTLDPLLEHPDVSDVTTCAAGFMGWTSVSRLTIHGPAPAVEGDPISDEQGEALVESLRASLPSLIGTERWSPVASGRSMTPSGDTDTRVLYSSESGAYLFIFDHAG